MPGTRFDIYCDELHPDLLASKNPKVPYFVIGGIWLPFGDREQYKTEIHALRDKYKIGPEFKWEKVSHSRMDFYKGLIDWFISKENILRFRAIVVKASEVNLENFHGKDQELGFYKFYYHMIKHWLRSYNEYAIFCDYKTNASRDRIPVLRRCLNSTQFAYVRSLQAVRSRESVLLQLVDVLSGAVSARFNSQSEHGSARALLLEHLEAALQRTIAKTDIEERKFNIFQIDLGRPV